MLHPERASTISNTILPALFEAIPEETIPLRDKEVGFKRFSYSLQPNHVTAYFKIASTVASEISKSPEDIIGNCTNEDQCVEAFLNDKAHYILRRPLTSEDKLFYKEAYGEVGLEGVLATLFMSPHFLMHQEYGNFDASPLTFALTPYELASKMSYALTGSMPDKVLFEKAKDGTLVDLNIREQQAARMVSSDRGHQHYRNFVTEWLHLDHIKEFDLSNPEVKKLWESGSISVKDVDPQQLISEAKNEILDLAEFYAFDKIKSERQFSKIFTGRYTTNGPQLTEHIYGQEYVVEEGIKMHADKDLQGILGRAGFNLLGVGHRHPILKGVKVLMRVLCQEINPPADIAIADSLIIEPDFTAIEVAEAKTQAPGTSCAGCHAVINPYGFVLETFDGFGRKSTVEHVLDKSNLSDPKVFASVPVDTQTNLIVGGTAIPLKNPHEMAAAISESFEAHRCFSQMWWRYVNKRKENLAKDSCELQQIYEPLETNQGGIAKGLLNSVLSQEFSQKTIKVSN